MMTTMMKTTVYLVLLASIVFLAPGCLGNQPANMDWAAPAVTTGSGDTDGIQRVLDTYANALVTKDRNKFASILDPASPAFAAQELERFDRLIDVPFDQYNLGLISQSQTSPGAAAVKVASAYTLRGSFTELPDLDQSAYFMVKGNDGWKLSGDANEQLLGKKREAQFEDFGKVDVLGGDHTIVLYHAPDRAMAEMAQRMTEASVPRLVEVIPGTRLPQVMIKVYSGADEINQSFPGKWQEWTASASRQLGENAGQGGEIIIDAQVLADTNASNPSYNQRLLAHELTHIVLFPQTGNRTPPFLIEGLADYIGGIEDKSLLKERLSSGNQFSPTLRDIYQPGGFTALLSTEAATLAYEEADTAVALLEKKYGNDKVLELLREFRRREQDSVNQDTLVNDTFMSVLGVSWNDFESEWRDYVLGS